MLIGFLTVLIDFYVFKGVCRCYISLSRFSIGVSTCYIDRFHMYASR